MTTHLAALPDTDGEVAHHLGRLEEVLLQLQPSDDPAPPGLGPDSLEALRRILRAVLAAEVKEPPPATPSSFGPNSSPTCWGDSAPGPTRRLATRPRVAHGTSRAET